MSSHADRYVDLEGCYNFRDLGGYRAADRRGVRRGLLFRSDALHHLTDADVARVRDELGVRAIVDVRSTREIRYEAWSPLAQPPVRYHHVPLFSDNQSDQPEEIPEDLGHRYFMILRSAARPLARVIELIAKEKEPTVFHCAAGKDRTGLISALILSLLGVDEEDVVEDYVATSRNLERIIARLRESPSYEAIFTELPPETLHAEAETMRSLLARVRAEFGSMSGYAEAVGIGAETRAQLVERLLERA